jgi:hypothetical protein
MSVETSWYPVKTQFEANFLGAQSIWWVLSRSSLGVPWYRSLVSWCMGLLLMIKVVSIIRFRYLFYKQDHIEVL